MRSIIISFAAAASLATLGLCSAASAQEVEIGPGGIGIDVGRGYGDHDGYREHRRWEHRRWENRRHGYYRRFDRDRFDDGDHVRRRHSHDEDRQDD
jgi:hypothetical protein